MSEISPMFVAEKQAELQTEGVGYPETKKVDLAVKRGF
jgi:hypothetical protein